jgi:iron(III) transport system substrate-binding protein
MTPRYLVRLAYVPVVALLVAACAGGASPSPSPLPSSTPEASEATNSPSPSPDPKAARDAVCAKARQEGKLVYWNNFANPDPIFEAFATAYPGIEVEKLANHPDDFVQALLTELTAGRPPTPDIMYGELNVLAPLFQMGADDVSIDWRALGVPDDLLPVSGNVVRLYRVAGGIVYNTNRHSAADLPDSWDGLIDPKWDHQIVVDPRGRPFDQLSLVWGHDQTIDYVKRLNALHPVVIKGGTAGMLAVASEQAAITTGGRSAETFEQKAKGAPLEIKYLDLVPTLDIYNFVPKGAAHPNAAACMVAWLATDGQKVHDQAEFKSNTTVPAGAPADAKIVSVDTPEQAEAVAAIGKEIGAIFTGTGN